MKSKMDGFKVCLFKQLFQLCIITNVESWKQQIDTQLLPWHINNKQTEREREGQRERERDRDREEGDRDTQAETHKQAISNEKEKTHVNSTTLCH